MCQRYFLRKDLEALREKMKLLRDEIHEVGKRVSEACEQGAETYHDNAPYEEAVRHQEILSAQLANLSEIARGAFPITYPAKADTVSIGTKVMVVFAGNDEPEEFCVGSFANFTKKENVISYASPLGQNLLGLRPGDVCSFTVGKRKIEVRLLEVRPLAVEER